MHHDHDLQRPALALSRPRISKARMDRLLENRRQTFRLVRQRLLSLLNLGLGGRG